MRTLLSREARNTEAGRAHMLTVLGKLGVKPVMTEGVNPKLSHFTYPADAQIGLGAWGYIGHFGVPARKVLKKKGHHED